MPIVCVCVLACVRVSLHKAGVLVIFEFHSNAPHRCWNKMCPIYICSNSTKYYPGDKCNVGPEKENTYGEGLLVAHWAQLLKTEPAAISIQGPLMQTALQGEACTELPASQKHWTAACTVFLLDEPAFMKSS